MIFFAYDLEEYENGRSFYYDYKEFIPGPLVKNTDEIIDEIKKAEISFDKEKIRTFRNKFMSACDGKSTQRIFDEMTK